MELFDKISKTFGKYDDSKVENNPRLKKYLSNLNDQYYKYKYSSKFQTEYKGKIYNNSKVSLVKKQRVHHFLF